MNYKKFKDGYYSQKYKDFRKIVSRLSANQKGEFLLSATEDKDLELITFLVEDLEAPIGYTNKNGTNGLIVLATNLYNREDLFKLDKDLDYKIAKFYLERMTSNEINAQEKFSRAAVLSQYSLPLLNVFKAYIGRSGQMSALMYLGAHHPHKIEIKLDNPYINEHGAYIKTELVEDTRVVDLIYLFRAYGAQTNLVDSNGLDVMKYAVAFDNLDAVKAYKAYIKPIKNSISLPADINSRDNYGNSSYMHACSRHKVEGLLEELEDSDLQESRANPNTTNIYGQSAVDVASPSWALDHVKEYTTKYNEQLNGLHKNALVNPTPETAETKSK